MFFTKVAASEKVCCKVCKVSQKATVTQRLNHDRGKNLLYFYLYTVTLL